MAQAIVLGGLDAGTLDPSRVVVADRNEAKRELFRAAGVEAVATPGDAMSGLCAMERAAGEIGQVLLAIKPQSLDEVAPMLAGAWGDAERVVISLLAGVSGERAARALGVAARIVRAMPNTPARIRRGATGVVRTGSAKEGDTRAAVQLFAAVGEVLEVETETHLDVLGAVAGSGPAYAFYLAEAMIDAGEGAGLPREVAERAVIATLAGAGELMARDSARDPGALRAAVTSRGGITLAAMTVLDAAGVKETIDAAVQAGIDRGRELGA